MSQKNVRLHLAVSGAGSIGLYLLLAMYSREILALSANKESGYFLVPIVIAFIFSFVHGAFTGYFWEALGVKAKNIPIQGKTALEDPNGTDNNSVR